MKAAVIVFPASNCDRDAATAFGWYSKSAMQGFGLAQYNLALCFLMGDGTPDGVRDEKQARFWMRKAEQNGLQQAEEALRTNFASLGQAPEQLSGRAPSPGPERRRQRDPFRHPHRAVLAEGLHEGLGKRGQAGLRQTCGSGWCGHDLGGGGTVRIFLGGLRPMNGCCSRSTTWPLIGPHSSASQ